MSYLLNYKYCVQPPYICLYNGNNHGHFHNFWWQHEISEYWIFCHHHHYQHQYKVPQHHHETFWHQIPHYYYHYQGNSNRDQHHEFLWYHHETSWHQIFIITIIITIIIMVMVIINTIKSYGITMKVSGVQFFIILIIIAIVFAIITTVKLLSLLEHMVCSLLLLIDDINLGFIITHCHMYFRLNRFFMIIFHII